jgi:hypothetical protein
MRTRQRSGQVIACLLGCLLVFSLFAGAAAEAPALASVTVDKPLTALGETLTWTAAATGDGALSYRFFLFKNRHFIQKTDLSSSPLFSYTPTEAGLYAVYAQVTDGTVSAYLKGGAARVYAPLSVTSVKAGKAQEVIGCKISWTAAAAGGMGEKTWRFELFKDGTSLQVTEFLKSRRFTFTPSEVGSYKVLVTVKDDTGEASLESGDVAVSLPPALAVVKVEASRSQAVAGMRMTWHAKTTGGIAPITYSFELFRDGVSIRVTEFKRSREFTSVLEEQGEYFVRVTAKDSSGTTAALDSAAITVAARPALSLVSIHADRGSAYVGRRVTWCAKATLR